MSIDFETEPLGHGTDGPVFLRDIWPGAKEVEDEILRSVKREMFTRQYSSVFDGDEMWKEIDAAGGTVYEWKNRSTYVKSPPFFDELSRDVPPTAAVKGARVLGMYGDSITTDHISPAGSIPRASPAGKWLLEQGVEPLDFNSYGARRGNHEVMMRGTFANIRLKNELAGGKEGWWTSTSKGGEATSMYDAAMQYKSERVPLLIIAGKEYGTGSSRDWAAKGTSLLGIRAVIAESFERIHRSNLVGMGVLPLEFMKGETRATLGLSGFEEFEIEGLDQSLEPGALLTVRADSDSGSKSFKVLCRIDIPEEMQYYKHGGILHYVLRKMVTA
jgi:aconitate hydratase